MRKPLTSWSAVFLYEFSDKTPKAKKTKSIRIPTAISSVAPLWYDKIAKGKFIKN